MDFLKDAGKIEQSHLSLYFSPKIWFSPTSGGGGVCWVPEQKIPSAREGTLAW